MSGSAIEILTVGLAIFLIALILIGAFGRL